MSEKAIVKAIKEHVRKQDNDWKLFMGRDVLTAVQVIQRLDNDREFRKLLVEMVVTQTVEILGKGA